jgi:nicotinate-nucleotide adenylyltransferase
MIGILGGTFDPIHYGHLRPAQEALRALPLTEIRLVPAGQPPHRRAPVASAAHRLRMAELAVADLPGFVVDDREIRRRGPSYTVLTLEALRAELGEQPLCLLLGMDAFAGLETWHQWERLPLLAHLVVLTRPGWKFPSQAELHRWARDRLAPVAAELARAPAGRIYFQAVTPQEISASGIREAIAHGRPVAGLLPPAVLDYIRQNRLYLHQED